MTTGKALSRGGPLGLLLAYGIVGLLIAFVVMSMAELSALVPLSGGIVRPAEYFFDPVLSFAQGWNTVYATAVLLPAEMVASAVIIEYWINVSPAIWITVLGGLLLVSNFFLVRVYGELEFIFAMLKIMLVVGTIIMVRPPAFLCDTKILNMQPRVSASTQAQVRPEWCMASHTGTILDHSFSTLAFLELLGSFSASGA